ncbi:nudC domain-containing protein 2 isoform X2 [Erinaceus europaeus]|uniref:NudC domain-containing protein 2 isoform X2 n=1 Tax=Erinaceus europaeus TaxID=9365 RepID=A0A1S3WWH7_ERIEU|nr:nudC domain-containing protein 2 isoform X2 [Erinaceus europaeus]
MSAPFEERSGVVPCGTPWGQWYQTLEEVFIEVRVPPGTRAQDVRCGLHSRHLSLAVGGRDILKGRLFDATIADEGTWTLVSRWPLSLPRGQEDGAHRPDEDQAGRGQLLDVSAGVGVRGRPLGVRPDAEEAHPGALPEGESWF